MKGFVFSIVEGADVSHIPSGRLREEGIKPITGSSFDDLDLDIV
jgi:hypothetical protein